MRNRILIILLLLSTTLHAQIAIEGTPLPYSNETSTLRSTNSIIVNAGIDTTAALPDYGTLRKQATGYVGQVDLSPANSGTIFSDGKGGLVWRVGITSPGAASMSVIFDRFNIPDGATLFMYNPSQSIIKGAYTNINRNNSGILPVQPLYCDTIIIEYREATKGELKGDIHIGSVAHNTASALRRTASFYCANTCSPHASLNSDLEPYRRATILMYVTTDKTSWYGTGQLINNADGKPYIYTAAHCIKEKATQTIDYSERTVYHFNYEVPAIDTLIQPSTDFTIAGGSTIAVELGLDMALIELSQMPPKDYMPYMMGWDLTASPAATLTSIQHPKGDIKRVSRCYKTPRISTFDGTLPGTKINNSFWKIDKWDVGTTQGGSSGSALLDANYRIIGVLTGGQSTCDSPNNDFYSRISYAYDYYQDSDKQLKCWLDPHSSGISQMDGTDPYDGNACTRYRNFDDDAELKAFNNCGHDEEQDTEVAEHFTFDGEMTLWGAIIVPYKGRYNSAQPLYLTVYQGGTDKPGTLLAKTVIHPTDVFYNRSTGWKVLERTTPDLSNRETYVRLAQPLKVNNDCYVGCQYSYYASTDTFKIYSTTDVAESSALIRRADNQWYDFNNLSLWIEPIMSKYDPTEISENSNNESDIVTYPNPTSDGVVWIAGDEARYAVYNMQGFLVKNGMGNRITLPAAKGIYLIHITRNNVSATHKIIRL